jgi:hypothetical protein
MWIRAFIIVSGICTFFCFYMTFLAFRINDNGGFLFLGFGLFWGTIFVISAVKAAATKSAFFKQIDTKISGESKPVVFVPHWFMMLALIITGIAILAAIFIPVFFR